MMRTPIPVGAWAAHEFSWPLFQRFVTAPTATAKTDMIGILSATPDENGERCLDRDSAPVDPWGRPYEYVREADPEESFVLMTYGADGARGGEGREADIFSSDVKPRGRR